MVYCTTFEIQERASLFIYFICLHQCFEVKLAFSEFVPLLAVEISDDWIIGNKKTKHIFNLQEYGYLANHKYLKIFNIFPHFISIKYRKEVPLSVLSTLIDRHFNNFGPKLFFRGKRDNHTPAN